MPLNELNDDVLRLIITFLDSSGYDRSNILSLALTCHRLHRLANNFIPRAVSLIIPSLKFSLLRRCMNEDLAYGQKILELGIQKYHSSAITQSEFHSFLQNTPNLRHLDVANFFDLPVAPILLYGELSLRNTLMDLSLAYTTAQELLQLATFPKLHHISSSISSRDLSSMEISSMESTTHIEVQLKSLDIISPAIGTLFLGTVLSYSSKLSTLKCPIPLRKEGIMISFAGELQICYPLSPIQIVPILMPVAGTLTHLELSTEAQIWPGYDTSRLDISRFRMLKSLKASALCFMCPLELNISRDGFYELLPRSLEHLQVRKSPWHL